MNVLTTRELKERLNELQGQTVMLQGWIRNHRKQKNMGFIDFFDGTCFKNPQVVYDNTIEDYAAIQTLHVGAGTFLPVKTEDTKDHKMHAEYCIITPEACEIINKAKRDGRRIIAVGTTSVRLLESAADDNGILHPFNGETSIFITPGYKFKVIDYIITNFHLPKSTLFMLICAIAGTERMKAAYAHAVKERYRFYSYGDSSILKCVNKI